MLISCRELNSAMYPLRAKGGFQPVLPALRSHGSLMRTLYIRKAVPDIHVDVLLQVGRGLGCWSPAIVSTVQYGIHMTLAGNEIAYCSHACGGACRFNGPTALRDRQGKAFRQFSVLDVKGVVLVGPSRLGFEFPVAPYASATGYTWFQLGRIGGPQYSR